MIVRSINNYPHIKVLCRFFNSLSNTVELRDDETLAVTSGEFNGLTFAFEMGVCNVSTCNGSICFDFGKGFDTEALMQGLVKHHIIKCVELS
ncbi:hypothetical protein [Mucilaginibacter pedocola]|uniref:Uncharacterized protein n=1 Tax=Mucilaginibacter pedocola TaxID=1792845 RepID=A0A1S9PDP7_9SPHI|nr:hypothetical protein [Mucilaginibacter pedocola]OOQ58708.1 hypothetical protein BC343_08570 [Mucilaginibacter pedocola]